jgi:hypothetical protein
VPQITLYVDNDTDAKARAAAAAAGLSYSRWVVDLIRTRIRIDEWPSLIREMAGGEKDFPLRA